MQNPNNPPVNPNRSLQRRPQSRQQADGEIVEYREMETLITPSTPLSDCPTNLNLLDKREAALAVSAMGVPDITLDKTGRAVIKVRYFLCYADWLPREDGQGHDAVIYTVFISKDGNMFKTTGVYGPRAARAAAELFSARDWEDGITAVITERATAKGRRAHSIQWVIDAEDGVGPETKGGA